MPASSDARAADIDLLLERLRVLLETEWIAEALDGIEERYGSAVLADLRQRNACVRAIVVEQLRLIVAQVTPSRFVN